jgi:hypothetical protein
MASRRKPRPAAVGGPPAISRSAARDEQVRAALTPYRPGERPRALLLAVAVAVVLGVVNLIAFLLGTKIQGHHPGPAVLAFSALMALMAGGMWRARYLAVLAFEALLALIVMTFSLFLIEASNLEGLAVALAVIASGGWLFWKLVRVMGRLATPRSERV